MLYFFFKNKAQKFLEISMLMQFLTYIVKTILSLSLRAKFFHVTHSPIHIDLQISRPIPVQCRIRLLVHVQNDHLYLLKPLFN
jgi:hypothetical protein